MLRVLLLRLWVLMVRVLSHPPLFFLFAPQSGEKGRKREAHLFKKTYKRDKPRAKRGVYFFLEPSMLSS